MSALRTLILLLLAAFLVWKGIVPALTQIDTDFPNYYTSAKLFHEGADVSQFYDDAWFAQQIRGQGIEVDGKFFPFPPLTVVLMMPLSGLPPLSALQVWTGINLLLLGAIFLILKRFIAATPLIIAGIILGSGIGLANNFRFGQWYVMLLFIITCGYYYWQKGSPAFAGMLFGIGAVFKYFPLLFLILFALRREWKGLLACLGTFVLLNLAGAALVGIAAYATFFRSVLWNHISANMQNPFSAVFQSWESLFRRLFVADPALNPEPFIDFPAGFVIGTSLMIGFVVIVTSRTMIHLRRSGYENTLAHQFVVLTLMGLALLPASATYHFVLLVLPMAILFSLRAQMSGPVYYAILGLYFILGFIPYRFFIRFDGSGLYSVFAYPRLAVITAILFTAIIVTEQALRRKLVSPSVSLT